MTFEDSFFPFMETIINFIEGIEHFAEKKQLQRSCSLDLEEKVIIDNKSNISLCILQGSKASFSVYSTTSEDANSVEIKTKINNNNKTVVTIIPTKKNILNVSLLIQIPSTVTSLGCIGTNGNIKCDKLNIDILNIQLTNGNILCQSLKGKNYQIETINGKIMLCSSIFDICELKTRNGNIFVSDCGSQLNLIAQSNNGKVSVMGVVQGEGKKLECLSFNGNILIKK